MPKRMAPAWPLTPPPSSVASTSYTSSVCVKRSGSFATTWCVRIGKYAANGRPLTTICPVPGRSRTRATASLRRPVVWMRGLGTSSPSCSQSPSTSAEVASACAVRQRALRGLLRVVGMRRAPVDPQLPQHAATERSLREHAAHRELDDTLRIPSKQVLERFAANTTGVARVAPVDLVSRLLRRDRELRRVDHDDVVAGVEVRREDRLVLAAQQGRDLGGETTEDRAVGIDHMPLVSDVGCLGRERTHETLLPSERARRSQFDAHFERWGAARRSRTNWKG